MHFDTVRTRIRAYWESISTSYWFIPCCMMAFSLVLCYGGFSVIRRTSVPDGLIPLFPLVTQAGAQQLLSTIATSIITATSIAFSMTIVALTMASSQFGPRLLRTFMLDKGTQTVLGTLVATFVFCLISLHHLSAIQENPDAIAILSGISALLALIDVLAIIFFIHHLSRSIQADSVVHHCYADFHDDLDNLLPKPENLPSEVAIPEAFIKPADFTFVVTASHSGFVQTISYTQLLERHFNGLSGVVIHVRSGDHVLANEPLMELHSTHPVPEGMASRFRQYVLMGSQRTPVQDPEFAINQLVEIALRALSPGINDPYTAMTCIDRLTAACEQMSQRSFPAHCIVNKDSNVWLKRRTFNLTSVINKAYDQIRQAGFKHLSVGLYLLTNMGKLYPHLEEEHRQVLREQAQATVDMALKNELCRHDRHTLEQAFQQFLKACDGCDDNNA